MPAWARPPTPHLRWRPAATPCCWRARSRAPRTPLGWRAPCARRSRRVTRRVRPAASPAGSSRRRPHRSRAWPSFRALSERGARARRGRRAGRPLAFGLGGFGLRVLLHAGRDLRGPGGGGPAARSRGPRRPRRRPPPSFSGPQARRHGATARARVECVRAVARAGHPSRGYQPVASGHRSLRDPSRRALPRADRRRGPPRPWLLRPLRRSGAAGPTPDARWPRRDRAADAARLWAEAPAYLTVIVPAIPGACTSHT